MKRVSRPEPIRILHIIARLNIGGPAIYAIELAERFSKDGFRTLLIAGSVGREEGDMGYLVRDKNVALLTIPELGRELSPKKDVRAFLSIRRIMNQFQPHIVHTHTAKAGALGRLAALSLNRQIALVHTFHGHVFEEYFGRFKTAVFLMIERMLARFTDRIIVISGRQYDDICKRFNVAPPYRVRVIPLGFDLSRFLSISKAIDNHRRQLVPDAPDDCQWIGFVGRLAAIKNVGQLIESASRLKAKGQLHRFLFVLVGDGEMKHKLMRDIGQRDLEPSFRFLGWQRNMERVYTALDAVVLTSLNEGTPVSLIEAMAAQRVTIANAVGGVPDLMGPSKGSHPEGFVSARNGILVPPNDAAALANALCFIDREPGETRQMAHNARQFVQKHYTLDRLEKDMSSLYGELAGDLRY